MRHAVLRPSIALARVLVFSLVLGLVPGLGLLVPHARADDTAVQLKVLVTSKPIHALVASVMAGLPAPRVLISGAQSPHTYALKPSDAAAAAEAEVVFRVSAAIEPFTTRLFDSLPARTRRVSLADSPGVTHLPTRAGASFAPHYHTSHAHGAGHADAHDDDDGHVWLDPDNARAMVADIARVLQAAAPAHTSRLAANAAAVSERIAALDRDIAARLAPVRDRPFVLFHDATQYFERHYGLKAVGAIVSNPDAPPSARRLSDVRARIRSAHVSCVFAEPEISRRLVEAVREGTTARVGLIDPAGTMLPAGPDLYVDLMRGLADSFVSCLAGR